MACLCSTHFHQMAMMMHLRGSKLADRRGSACIGGKCNWQYLGGAQCSDAHCSMTQVLPPSMHWPQHPATCHALTQKQNFEITLSMRA